MDVEPGRKGGREGGWMEGVMEKEEEEGMGRRI